MADNLTKRAIIILVFRDALNASKVNCFILYFFCLVNCLANLLTTIVLIKLPDLQNHILNS
jgi:hypothetical protein